MPPQHPRLSSVENAFLQDDFEIRNPHQDVRVYRNKLGVRATHKTATNRATGAHKTAFYLEGEPYETGFLLGCLAEPEISRMTNDYVNNVVFDFLDVQLPQCLIDVLGEILVDVIDLKANDVVADLPRALRDEMSGLLAGCQAAKPGTRVDLQGLRVLNVGVDCIQSFLFGLFRARDELPARLRAAVSRRAGVPVPQVFEIKPEYFRLPMMCNSLSVFGQAANNGHFFGRDFMFPTAGVYQDVATLIIHQPGTGYPFVSQTAPGMIGCVAGLSMVDRVRGGLGVGVHLAAGANSNPGRPGFNSLPLARHCIQHAGSARQAVDIMQQSPRGVSYIYPVGDGVHDTACVVEAGMATGDIDFLSYPPFFLLGLLPDQEFLDMRPTTPQRNGLMVRWNDFPRPPADLAAYLAYNPALYTLFEKHPDAPDNDPQGLLNASWKKHNCPQSFYFAPQRENRPDVLLATNSFLVPEMRLCSMDPWVDGVAKGDVDSIQWRYDALNRLVLQTISAQGAVATLDQAQELIDYLRPYDAPGVNYQDPPPFAGFHDPHGHGSGIVIEGSVSAMDLKNLTIRSHFGCYEDEWVTIHLDRYV